MGASKSYQFSHEEIDLSLTARALSHPARVAIVRYLKQHFSCTSLDLIPVLRLSKGTIHDHVVKLKDAGLINGTFTGKFYSISLHPEHIHHFHSFVTSIYYNQPLPPKSR